MTRDLPLCVYSFLRQSDIDHDTVRLETGVTTYTL